jgi:hypothetical protein
MWGWLALSVSCGWRDPWSARAGTPKYDGGMRETKVVLTIPREVLKRARAQVTDGSAKSLSALVSQALEEKLARNDLADLLETVDLGQGRHAKSSAQWAERLLRRRASTTTH